MSPATAQAVRNFQILNGLDADGIVGSDTWYKLRTVYGAVAKLAELRSEGLRFTSFSWEYPERVEPGESGAKVTQLQYMLRVIAAFNVTKEQQPVEGVVRPSDVPGLNGESFVVYEYYTKTVRVISADEGVRFTLRDIDDYRLFSIIPYADGFAPIGRLDKFLSHAAITSQIGGAVKLYEPGPYGYVRDKMFIREDCHA